MTVVLKTVDQVFMLIDDDKIKDASVRSQIQPGR
jgi:hypothetical protein